MIINIIGPAKFTGTRTVDAVAVDVFSSGCAIFIDSQSASNIQFGAVNRFTFSGSVVGASAGYDGTYNEVYSAWIAKVDDGRAIASWAPDVGSGSIVPQFAIMDDSDPPSVGTVLNSACGYTGNSDSLKTIVLSASRAVAMARYKRELFNLGISSTTVTKIASTNMFTETLGVALTDICRIDDTTALLIASQGAFTATSYPEGVTTCSGTNCSAAQGTPDNVGATWGSGGGWAQIEFNEKPIGSSTSISARWKTLSSPNGTLYLDAKIDGSWTRIRTSANQGSSVWKWEPGGGLAAYNGQQLSGIKFGFSSGGARAVDTFSISNFYDPNPNHSAWVIHTTGSAITYSAQAYLPGVINCKHVIGLTSTEAFVLYNDYDATDTLTGLKAMVLSLVGDNVLTNTGVLLKNTDVDRAQVVPLWGGIYGVIYEVDGAMYVRSITVSGTVITDGDDEVSVGGSYTLSNINQYDDNKAIATALGTSDDGYYLLLDFYKENKRVLGLSSDETNLYLTNWEDGTFYCDAYEQSVKTLTASFGSASESDVISGCYRLRTDQGPFVFGLDGSGSQLHLSTNSGCTFENLSASGWTDTDKLISFNAEGLSYLAVFSSGSAWITGNGSPGWEKSGSTGAIVEGDGNKVYLEKMLVGASAEGQFYYTLNQGQTWEQSSAELSGSTARVRFIYDS